MADPQAGTLAAKVRTKYPGAYDDMSDQQLESAVRTKFPGVYDDMPLTTGRAPAAAPSTPQAPQTVYGAIGEAVRGAGAGLATTVFQGGDLIDAPTKAAQRAADAATEGVQVASLIPGRSGGPPANAYSW